MSDVWTGRRAALERWARGTGWGVAAVLALVVSTQGTQNAVANGDTRTLRLYHNHTKESLTVTFRRNGQYDARGLEQLNWFLRDWRRDEPTTMDPRLFDTLWAVYREVGSDDAIHVNSAYRSPRTNSMLRRRSSGVAKNSQHMRGKAMDFYLPDVPIERIRSIGMRLQNGGVGYYPSAYTPFVHLDVGSVRAWPRMTRDQLARIFPDGKTVHIPADGEPMARYEEAKAEVLARGGSVGGYTAIAEAGEGAAPAPQRKSFWARLFGGGDEDEDAEEVSTRGRQAYVARRAPPPNIYGNSDSPTAVLAQYEAAQAAQAAARTRRPDPAPAIERPIPAAPEPDAPRPVPTRIAGLPSTVETPAGPRLAWQQGPAGQAGATEIAFAPMPPRRPEDVGVTGAVAFAPMPPTRPGPLAATNPIPGIGLPAALAGADHPMPPPRPERPISVAAVGLLPLAAGLSDAPQATTGAARDQLRALAAASLTMAPARPMPPAAPRLAPAAPALQHSSAKPVTSETLLTAGPSLPPGFTSAPGALATNRFTGSAVQPVGAVQ